MKYKNPDYKKTKKSYNLKILCAYCKSETLLYEKVGKGGVIRLYMTRIVEGNIDFIKLDKILQCPNCGEHLGIKGFDEKRNAEIFNMIKGSFNVKKI